MNDLVSQIISLVSKSAPSIITLFAVYLGWKLNSYNERRKRALELLDKQFDAFIQLREVIDNIPRGITSAALAARMAMEPELLNSLKHRLTRLFGLRRELVPHLDDKIISLIDKNFFPLFQCETGTCELKPDSTEAFARCCEELILETDSLEKRLVTSYQKVVK